MDLFINTVIQPDTIYLTVCVIGAVFFVRFYFR